MTQTALIPVDIYRYFGSNSPETTSAWAVATSP